MVELFCIVLELSKSLEVTQFRNGRFEIVRSQNLIGSFTDIAKHICQIETSISLLVVVVIKGLMIWASKCHQKKSSVVYVMAKYEESEVDRLAILQTPQLQKTVCFLVT